MVDAGGDPVGPEDFDPVRYWNERYDADPTVLAAGDRTLGRRYNAWLYRGMRAGVGLALDRAGVDLRGAAVCDIGAGPGGWVGFWTSRGARPVCLDLAGASSREVARMLASDQVLTADVTDASSLSAAGLEAGRFDLVAMINVAFHLGGYEAFAAGLRNAASLVGPGGFLLVTDRMGEHEAALAPYETHRPLDAYEAALAPLGFAGYRVRPMVLTMLPPVGQGGGALAAVAGTAASVTRRFARGRLTRPLTATLGLLLWLCDMFLLRVARSGPSLNVLLARKGVE